MSCAILLNLLAFHAAASFNTFTPGAGALCQVDQVSAMAGVLANSEGRRSSYAALAWQPVQVGPWQVGALAGAIDGYTRGKVSPLAGAVASTCLAPLGGRLHVIATPAHQGSPWTLAVAMSFSGEACHG